MSQHIIGHMGTGFHGSNDPTNSVKALKEQTKLNQIEQKIQYCTQHNKIRSEELPWQSTDTRTRLHRSHKRTALPSPGAL